MLHKYPSFSGSQFTSYNLYFHTKLSSQFSKLLFTHDNSCDLHDDFFFSLKKCLRCKSWELVTSEDKIVLFCFLQRHYKHALFLPAWQAFLFVCLFPIKTLFSPVVQVWILFLKFYQKKKKGKEKAQGTDSVL